MTTDARVGPGPIAALLALQVGLAAWFVSSGVTGTDAAWRGLPLDDAWIHLVYGRALLESGLPAYNPGQLETGFTSPLQMVVAAAAEALARAGVPVAVALKGLTLLCTLPATALAAQVAARRGGPAAGLAAGALLAMSPTWAFTGVSGMEVGLCGTLLVATWWALDRDRPGLAALAFAGAFVARPEAVVLAPLVAWQGGLRVLGPAVVAGLLWAAYDLVVSGEPLPATFYVKQQAVDLRRLPVAAKTLTQAWPMLGCGVGLVAWGLGVARAAREGWRADIAWALVPWVWVGAVAAGRLIAPHDEWYYFLRYFLPVEAVLVVPIGVGLAWAARVRWGWLAWLALAVVLLLDVPELRRRRALYAWNCENIEQMQGAAADWLAANAAPGDAVATVDAGRLRYASGLRVVDVVGLNNHGLLDDPALRAAILSQPERTAAWMDREGIRWFFTFPGVLPFTTPAREPARWFARAWEVRAEPYTLAGPEQQLAWIVRRLEAGADAAGGAEPGGPGDAAGGAEPGGPGDAAGGGAVGDGGAVGREEPTEAGAP